MRATEMHDLLADALGALEALPLWHHGTGQFSNIQYCKHCGYSAAWIDTHGHGEQCLIDRLRKATSTERTC